MKPKIMGIDPGSHWMGWGLITVEGGDLAYLDSGVLKGRSTDTINTRLKSLGKQLKELQWELKPTHVAMESGFVGPKRNAIQSQGRAQGVCIMAVAPVIIEYTPAEVKKAVSKGNATKPEVAQAVSLILGIYKDFKHFDESDALAVAIAHANALRLAEVIERGES